MSAGIFSSQFFKANAVTRWHKFPKLFAKSLLIQSSNLSCDMLPSLPKDTSLIK